MMIRTELNQMFLCDDGICVHAQMLHELPFIPPDKTTAIYLPGLPDGWNEEDWYMCAVYKWINKDGTVGIADESLKPCFGTSEEVSSALSSIGWTAKCIERKKHATRTVDIQGEGIVW